MTEYIITLLTIDVLICNYYVYMCGNDGFLIHNDKLSVRESAGRTWVHTIPTMELEQTEA